MKYDKETKKVRFSIGNAELIVVIVVLLWVLEKVKY